jgi:hypothetical protein
MAHSRLQSLDSFSFPPPPSQFLIFSFLSRLSLLGTRADVSRLRVNSSDPKSQFVRSINGAFPSHVHLLHGAMKPYYPNTNI